MSKFYSFYRFSKFNNKFNSISAAYFLKYFSSDKLKKLVLLSNHAFILNSKNKIYFNSLLTRIAVTITCQCWFPCLHPYMEVPPHPKNKKTDKAEVYGNVLLQCYIVHILDKLLIHFFNVSFFCLKLHFCSLLHDWHDREW